MWKTSHVSFLLVTVSVLTVISTLYIRSFISAAIDKRIRQLQNTEAQDLGTRKNTKIDPIKMMSSLSKKIPSAENSHLQDNINNYEEPVRETRPPPSGSGSRWTPL